MNIATPFNQTQDKRQFMITVNKAGKRDEVDRIRAVAAQYCTNVPSYDEKNGIVEVIIPTEHATEFEIALTDDASEFN